MSPELSCRPPSTTPARRTEFAEASQALASIQDALVSAEISTDHLRDLTEKFREVTHVLSQLPASDHSDDPLAVRWFGGVGVRDRRVVPELIVTSEAPGELHATAVFPRRFTGIVSVHGGFISVLFDELLGELADRGAGGFARTAELTISFHEPVPPETELSCEARVIGREGRKIRLEGAILSNGVTLSRARGLWIETRNPTLTVSPASDNASSGAVRRESDPGT